MVEITDKEILAYFEPETLQESTETIPYWLNKKQQDFKNATQKFKCFVGGRGSGKSHVSGDHLNSASDEMPGSRGLIYGMDFGQLETKEIVEIISVWKSFGMTEYNADNPMGEFVIGVKPPSGWKIIHRYKNYKNVISFPDGSVMELISGQQGASAKGGSYDYGIMCEAVDCDKLHFWDKVFPMVRGAEGKYGSHYYLSWAIFSNMPYTIDRYWVPDLSKLADQEPNKYYYIESDIWDNVDFYGEEYIKELQRITESAAPLVWAVGYMNQKKFKIDNPFYKFLDPNIHLYFPEGNIDPFYKYLNPIDISLDFNKDMNSMSVWQDFYCLNRFITDGNGFYTDMADDFLEYYHYRQIKHEVHIYGDETGFFVFDEKGQNRFEGIIKVFKDAGWTVVLKVKKGVQNPFHFKKHQLINKGLDETKNLAKIRINGDKAMDVYVSMANAPLGKNFKKDKSSEKKLKGKDRKLATDLSDTADYILYPKLSRIVNGKNGKGTMTVEVL